MKQKRSEAVANVVRIYIRRRPFLLSYLQGNLLNYSQTARHIASELYGSAKNHHAVKAALLRMVRRERAQKSHEDAALSVLSGSSLELRTKIAVVLSKKPLKIPIIAVASSRSGITSIIDEKNAPRVSGAERVIRGLCMITLCAKPAIEKTPGVMVALLSALADSGINVVEFTSCYYDILLVIDEKDTAATLETIKELSRSN
ncbi:MAG: ACT domain-containing protein [Candidatus Micrarchaeota archaeon]